jgi:hypothetical protein
VRLLEHRLTGQATTTRPVKAAPSVEQVPAQ